MFKQITAAAALALAACGSGPDCSSTDVTCHCTAPVSVGGETYTYEWFGDIRTTCNATEDLAAAKIACEATSYYYQLTCTCDRCG